MLAAVCAPACHGASAHAAARPSFTIPTMFFPLDLSQVCQARADRARKESHPRRGSLLCRLARFQAFCPAPDRLALLFERWLFLHYRAWPADTDQAGRASVRGHRFQARADGVKHRSASADMEAFIVSRSVGLGSDDPIGFLR